MIKKTLIIVFYFILNFLSAQSNDELIETLINSNIIQLEYNNMGHEFGELLKQITDKELFELAKNGDPIISTYAKIGIINKGKGNIKTMIQKELKRDITLEVYSACNGDYKTTSGILYETFYVKKYINALNHYNVKEINIDSIVSSSKIFNELDSIIIYSDSNINQFVFDSVFSKRYANKHLKRIEKLAFEMNNSYAFFYLLEHYEKKYLTRQTKYFTEQFLDSEFKTYNEVKNLIYYLEYLLDSEDEKMYEIGIRKMKIKEWKNHEYEFIIERIIEEKGIKL